MEGRRVPIPLRISILIASLSVCPSPFPSHPHLHPGCAHVHRHYVDVQGHTCWHRGCACTGRHTFVPRGSACVQGHACAQGLCLCTDTHMQMCCTVLEPVLILWVSLPRGLPLPGGFPSQVPSPRGAQKYPCPHRDAVQKQKRLECGGLLPAELPGQHLGPLAAPLAPGTQGGSCGKGGLGGHI